MMFPIDLDTVVLTAELAGSFLSGVLFCRWLWPRRRIVITDTEGVTRDVPDNVCVYRAYAFDGSDGQRREIQLHSCRGVNDRIMSSHTAEVELKKSAPSGLTHKLVAERRGSHVHGE